MIVVLQVRCWIIVEVVCKFSSCIVLGVWWLQTGEFWSFKVDSEVRKMCLVEFWKSLG